MKKYYLIFLGFYLLFYKPLIAQDKITDLNGNERLAIITEITPDSILYKLPSDSVNQKVYSLPKNQLFMATFKNGTKEIFLEKGEEAEVLPQISKQEYFQIGQLDARRNFKSKGAFWGTFAATFVPVLWPLGVLATGTAVSLSDPDTKNVIARKPEYKQNADYMLGYNKQAKKKNLRALPADLAPQPA